MSKREKVMELLKEGNRTTEEIIKEAHISLGYFRQCIYLLRVFEDAEIDKKNVWFVK